VRAWSITIRWKPKIYYAVAFRCFSFCFFCFSPRSFRKNRKCTPQYSQLVVVHGHMTSLEWQLSRIRFSSSCPYTGCKGASEGQTCCKEKWTWNQDLCWLMWYVHLNPNGYAIFVLTHAEKVQLAQEHCEYVITASGFVRWTL
jgi:hypothetical protein